MSRKPPSVTSPTAPTPSIVVAIISPSWAAARARPRVEAGRSPRAGLQLCRQLRVAARRAVFGAIGEPLPCQLNANRSGDVRRAAGQANRASRLARLEHLQPVLPR